MAYTQAGNLFVVISPAPSPQNFFSGNGTVQNEYDLEIQLVDPEHDTQLGHILPDSGELKNALVTVDLSYGRRVHAHVSGTYNGEGSELFLTM